MRGTQVPGHLFGPPVPHIGFFYGEHFLGEVRGHPSKVQDAKSKLLNSLRFVETGMEAKFKSLALLAPGAQAKLFCGHYSQPL